MLFTQFTAAGQVTTELPPFVNANVNPNAFPAGAFENVNVVVVVTVLLKLLPVFKFIVTLPPLPNAE